MVMPCSPFWTILDNPTYPEGIFGQLFHSIFVCDCACLTVRSSFGYMWLSSYLNYSQLLALGAIRARAKTDIAPHAQTRNTGAMLHTRTRTEESRAPVSFPSPVHSPGVSPPVSPGRGVHHPLLHGGRDSQRRYPTSPAMTSCI